jgi:pimeloyl-ACP methyl ester carboxylesterase
LNLVLLPGLDGTEIFLQPLLQALPSDVRPLVVTYPDAHRYEDLLPVVRNRVANLDRFHVLGWSFAGPLAVRLAASERERVRGVILSASFVRSPRPNLSMLRFAAREPAIWAWRAARRLPLLWQRISARVLARRIREVMAVDATESLRTCPQPLLYISASRDGIVPRRCVEEIVTIRPDVRLVEIHGEHFAMYSNPVPAARAIADFMIENP